jgi:exonuclease SbcD
VHYCGSPVSFSFSEKEDIKRVNIVEFTSDDLSVEFVEIPKFRALVSFSGTMKEIQAQLKGYIHNNPLDSLGEVIINEKKESVTIRQELEALLLNQTNDSIRIIKSRLHFKNKVRGATDVFQAGTDVSEVTPMQMFEKKLELEPDLENPEDLKNAFREILEELNL